MPIELPDDVTFKEFTGHDHASPTIELTDAGFATRRMYWLNDWSYIKDIFALVKGYPYVFADTGVRKLFRSLPLRDPQFDSLVATNISLNGVGTPGTDTFPPGTPGPGWDGMPDRGAVEERGNTYAKGAMFTVTFTRPTYRVLSDAQIGRTTSDTNYGNEIARYVEVQTVVENAYAAVSSGQNLLRFTSSASNIASGLNGGTLYNQFQVELKEPPPKVFAEANIVMRWHQVPYDYLPFRNIVALAGRINDCNWGIPQDETRYWRARRLLFLGAQWEQIQLADENLGWTVTYYFKYRQVPWTHFYNPYPQATAGYNPRDRDFYPVTIGTPGGSVRYDGNYPLSTVERDPDPGFPLGTPFAGYVAPDPNDFTYEPGDFRALFERIYTVSLGGG